MSQPPTFFPKNPLNATPATGSAQNTAARPAGQQLPEPRFGTPPQPTGAAPTALFKPAATNPATPVQPGAGAQPPPATPSYRQGGVGQSAFGQTPAGRPPFGQNPQAPASAAGQTLHTSAPGTTAHSFLRPTDRTTPDSALRGSVAPPRPGLQRTQQPAVPPLRTPLTPTAAFRAQSPAPTPQSTSPFRKELHISDEEFLQLRDFIYQQCGIFIAENRKYLVENRLSNRIKDLNLKSYNEYYNYLRYDVSRRMELNKLFEVVTTNETSFFRNPPQLDIFQKIVLPDMLEMCRKTGRKRLRIWSAGCSTGEEPYTLAIILHEVLKGEIQNWDIKITANDLSEAVLAAARRGFYSEYALRTTPREMVDAYFIKEGAQYQIKPELKALISFGQINLSDKVQLQRMEKSQIVFCRNVIIYFDDEMKRKVINAFYDNLELNGALLIGHSESLHNISRAFQLEHHKGTIVYRKLS